jgi:DNA-binding CsgD family transcriptional regulator
MTASGLLRERDLRALTAVVEDGLRDEPVGLMPWAVLDRLLDLIPADGVQVDDKVKGRETLLAQCVENGGERYLGRPADDDDDRFWQLRNDFIACNYSARSGDLVSVTKWSDFYSQAELKSTAFWTEYLAPDGPKYAVHVPLPSPPGRTRYLWFVRTDRDFSERDRLLLAVLRPHLSEVFLDAERRLRGIPRLSRRELEVLQLAAQGYSNADIARILFISLSTVRKHMENIFNRTGVRTRSAAAALALPRASLAAPLVVPPETRRSWRTRE